MQQGSDEPSSSAGGGRQQLHGGAGCGAGGGVKQKRHKPHHRPSHRPTAAPAPAVDLPLPEGGTYIDGSMLEGGGQILRNASVRGAVGFTAKWQVLAPQTLTLPACTATGCCMTVLSDAAAHTCWPLFGLRLQALAAILGRPLKVNQIRAGRDKPGELTA